MFKYLLFLGLFPSGIIGQSFAPSTPILIPGQSPQTYPYQQIQYPNYNPYLNNGMQFPYPLPFPYIYQPNGLNYPGYPIPQQFPVTSNPHIVQQIPVNPQILKDVDSGVEILEPVSSLIPLSPMDAAILDLKNNDYGHAEEYYYGRGLPTSVDRIRPRSGIPIQPFIRRPAQRNKFPPFTVNKPEHYEIYKYH